MQLERKDLEAATKQGLITSEQAQRLWSYWTGQQDEVPQFRLTHLLYYLGGLIAIGAVSIFVTQAWELLRGIPLFVLSSLFFLLGFLLVHYFLNKKLQIPAGIMATFSLAIVPLAVYNLQMSLGWIPDPKVHYEGFHQWVKWYWVPMEIMTLLAGVIMFYFYRFPFLLFPISIVLWYMSMDLWPLFFNIHDYSFTDRSRFSLYFGLVMLAAAVYMDLKYSDENKNDYAFWLYIFGVITFWGGLSCIVTQNAWSQLIYCLINVAMLLVSLFLNRRVFAVFGAFGILAYLTHLTFSVFAGSIVFPVVLVFLGLFIIFFAMKWSHIERGVMKYLQPYVPEKIFRRMNR